MKCHSQESVSVGGAEAAGLGSPGDTGVTWWEPHPTTDSGPTALGHRDKAHPHFIGSKSEVREVGRLAGDYKAGSDQSRFGAQACPTPESTAQGTSSPPDGPPPFIFLRVLGPLCAPCPLSRPPWGRPVGPAGGGSLGRSSYSHLPLDPHRAASVLWAQNVWC